jgi:hypothetical protein
MEKVSYKGQKKSTWHCLPAGEKFFMDIRV